VAIREGDEQLDRGEGVTYSRDTLEAMSKSAIKSMHAGRLTDRDTPFVGRY